MERDATAEPRDFTEQFVIAERLWDMAIHACREDPWSCGIALAVNAMTVSVAAPLDSPRLQFTWSSRLERFTRNLTLR
jgi:hypothetical protein